MGSALGSNFISTCPHMGRTLGDRGGHGLGRPARAEAPTTPGWDGSQPGADGQATSDQPLDPEPPRSRRAKHDDQHAEPSLPGTPVRRRGLVQRHADATRRGAGPAAPVTESGSVAPETRASVATASCSASHHAKRVVQGALAPTGIYLMREPRAATRLEENIGKPFAPFLSGISELHGMTASLAESGTGLGTAWGEE